MLTCCWDLQIYNEKDEGKQGHQLGKQVVLTLTEKLHGSGLDVTVDNFCSHELMTRSMTPLDTMRENHCEMPKELQHHYGKKLYSLSLSTLMMEYNYSGVQSKAIKNGFGFEQSAFCSECGQYKNSNAIDHHGLQQNKRRYRPDESDDYLLHHVIQVKTLACACFL